MERDVIVVGAGPAGATTAMGLARAGRDVMMIDRKAFPRDKTCGDAVPAGAIDIMIGYGMKDRIMAAEERGEFYPVSHMRLVSPRGLEVNAPFIHMKNGAKSYIAPRIFYDNALYEHAVESGAEFCQAQVKEPLVENGKVVGVRARVNGKFEDIRAKMVVAADGVTSVVARKLRPVEDKPQKAHRAIALRAYIENFKELPKKIEFFLYKGILPGYAWIFPTGNGSANIGLGMRIDKFENANEKLEDMLYRFMEFPEIKERSTSSTNLRDIATWQLNFGSQKIQRAFDGALFVGDAGGYINPLTGGGIHNALISAKVAVETIDAALTEKNFSRNYLLQYEERCDEQMWSSMVRSYRMQKWLMRFPIAIDALVRVMGGNSKFTQTFLEKL